MGGDDEGSDDDQYFYFWAVAAILGGELARQNKLTHALTLMLDINRRL